MADESLRPIATYRLQFNREFRFADAQALVAYFSRLGITHVYASPILRARQASTHGYDVVDPKTINPSLGDKTDLVNFATDLRKYGLGIILDIVPNHMAASIENPYWRDVLTYGRSSPFAGWFDIDWRLPDPNMWGRVLVPVLGEPRARVIEQEQIKLAWLDGRFLLQYFEHNFPVDPATIPSICQSRMQDLRTLLPDDHAAPDRIEEILKKLESLPSFASRLRRRAGIDREETEQWLAQFAQIVIQSPRLQQWVESIATEFTQGEAGRRRLRDFLDRQPYRLVHWRDAARTINYRRFFDVNELISVRQEDPNVFYETHSVVLRWINDGLIDGLRVDHIDGLRDPFGYLRRLAEAASPNNKQGKPIPIFVEKILEAEETLPREWPVAGTTGYEFLNEVEATLISREGFSEIEAQYRRLLRRPVRFRQFSNWGKRRVLRDDLSPQVGRLAESMMILFEFSLRNRSQDAESSNSDSSNDVKTDVDPSEKATSDSSTLSSGTGSPQLVQRHVDKQDFVDAIVEIIVALPVYRTYVDSNTARLSDSDRNYVMTAIRDARQSGRAAPEIVDYVGSVLLMDDETLPDHQKSEHVTFIQRFQQLTGPAAAKGIEDTALYAYVPLVSLNEVGGHPWESSSQRPDRTQRDIPDDVARLHQANSARMANHPQTMLCVTTHDTKRSADVRARLDVLSELAVLWSGFVQRWQWLNRPHRIRLRGKYAPDAATEYLFYQTVVGIWPAADPKNKHVLPESEVIAELRTRVEHYMLKAIREAKTHTSWTNPDAQYEAIVLDFVRNLLTPADQESTFQHDVQNLVARIGRHGFWNSLTRTLIQFCAPGTPDIYQGDELWNLALVDPDNRRPVDYVRRQELLDSVVTGIESNEEDRRAFLKELVDFPEDGRIKLHLIRSALAARRDFPELFANGNYHPLTATGKWSNRVIAFARTAVSNDSVEQAAIVVAPRLTIALVSEPQAAPVGESVWGDTTIQLPQQFADRDFTCAVSRERYTIAPAGTLPVSNILNSLPVALLLPVR